MSYFKYSSGGAYLNPEYEMSNALSHPNPTTVEIFSWESGFWTSMGKSKDWPFPCMYKNRPCWRGVNPEYLREKAMTTTDVWITTFGCKNLIVSHHDIRTPNDQEYKKYFEKFVTDGTYRIRYRNYTYGPSSFVTELVKV